MAAQQQPQQQGHVTSSRRLYLDKSGKAVDENDPTGVELFATSGSPISFSRAQEVGLIGEDGNLRADLFGMAFHPAPAATSAETTDKQSDFGKTPKTQSKEQE